MAISKIYYTYERDGEIYDAAFGSAGEALEHAEERFCEECEENGDWRNGETAEAEASIKGFTYNNDGERCFVSSTPATLEFEYYHGDFAEHNIY